MVDKESVRLECLKMALQVSRDLNVIIETAKVFEKHIDNSQVESRSAEKGSKDSFKVSKKVDNANIY